MFIRLFHARVRPGRQAEFKKTVEMLSLPAIQEKSGMIACYPGQPVGSGSNDFVLVTVWRDVADAETRTKEDWARAIVPEEALPLLEDWNLYDYKSFGVFEQPLKPLFKSI